MQEYPADEVDRIIGEEILRVEGTNEWYGPAARSRIQILLMSRICAAWSQPSARAAIEAVAAAEKNLLYLCSVNEVVYVFLGETYDDLISRLKGCEDAFALTLAAFALWPDPCAVCDAAYMRSGIEAVGEQWECARRELEVAHRQGKRVTVHNGVFAKIHEALMLGYGAFLTPAEMPELRAQFARAMVRYKEYSELTRGSDPTPRA